MNSLGTTALCGGDDTLANQITVCDSSPADVYGFIRTFDMQGVSVGIGSLPIVRPT